jgi:hypothetical protein
LISDLHPSISFYALVKFRNLFGNLLGLYLSLWETLGGLNAVNQNEVVIPNLCRLPISPICEKA